MKTYKIITKENTYDSAVISEYGQLLEVSFHLINSKKPFQIEKINYRVMTSLTDNLARWTSTPDQYVSAESIAKAISTIKKLINVQKKYIKASRLHPAYDDMTKIVKSRVKHYASDFNTHDKMQLGKDYTKPFIWLVRETGTWMLKNKGTFEQEIINQDAKEKNSDSYWYDGIELMSIGRDELPSYYAMLV